MSLHRFAEWLGETPISLTIKTVEWIIPAVQSVHILAVCVVASCALLIDLRLIGLLGRGQSIDAFYRRYLPWLWAALLVLAMTGAVMIVGEPARALENWVFWTKMATLVVAVLATLAFAVPMLKDRQYWERGGRRGAVRVLGGANLALWLAIAVCGRWIAYVL